MKRRRALGTLVPLGILVVAGTYYVIFGGPRPCGEIKSGYTITLVAVSPAPSIPVGVNNQWVPKTIGVAAATVDPTDWRKVASLEEQEVLMLVESGTEARVLDRAGRLLVIRILRGKYELKTGFVVVDHVDCRPK